LIGLLAFPSQVQWQPTNSQCIQEPSKELIHNVQAQILKDAQNFLEVGFEDAYNFVDRCPHKRLWMMLGDYALVNREFQHAIKAYVRLDDYNRIQYTKQVGRTHME
jgi:hypothetical protein